MPTLRLRRWPSLTALFFSLALLAENTQAATPIFLGLPDQNFPNARVLVSGGGWPPCTDPISKSCEISLTWYSPQTSPPSQTPAPVPTPGPQATYTAADTGPSVRTDQNGGFRAIVIVPPTFQSGDYV